MAKIISSSPEDLQLAAESLSQGKLVAFPTETVYGLGGNALFDETVKSIYAVKGRPSTDPLICHVDRIERAVKLWDEVSCAEAVKLATAIGRVLWPGPLTIVVKAHPSLPLSVTGGSGFVGARIPNHPISLALFKLLDFPVAGPSANTFGHVSPTSAAHVFADLSSRDNNLLIVDGGHCQVGIESTVIKIVDATSIEVLRRGKITVTDIQSAITKENTSSSPSSPSSVSITIRDTRSKFKEESAPMDGPGQLLTHYSPKVPASLVTPASVTALGSSPAAAEGAVKETKRMDHLVVKRGSETFAINSSVIIDFKGILSNLKDSALAYRDLSALGSVEEACFSVFEALRWSEEVQGATNVLFPFLSEWVQSDENTENLLSAVEDRLFRAASGTVVSIAFETENHK